MKKVVAVILSLLILVLAIVVAQAEDGLTLAEVENLLTSSTWQHNGSYGSTTKGFSTGFPVYAKTLNLPSSTIYLTEDGSGDIYIAVAKDEKSSTEMGKVTFSKDRNTMVIIVDNIYCTRWFTYKKK